jgi:glutamyl/glutaminyl-tRNA synthetase
MTRSRIAPTPSGFLHKGNAINFVLAWLHVRKENGSLRLRIDDLDAPRADPAFIDDIFYSLEWLGMDWDEGPQGPGEQYSKYSQQLRIDRYDELIGQLINTGKVFYCDCSRRIILGNSSDRQYPGACRSKGLQAGEGKSLRIITPDPCLISVKDSYAGSIDIDLYSTNRDPIIRRKDGIPAYHVASLADDTDHKTDLIVRGADLLHSTAAQLYLADLLGLSFFKATRFYHHPLIKDASGEKLSKSAGSASIKALREQGIKPGDFYLELSSMLGLKEKASSLNELLQVARQGESIFLK